MRVYGVFKQEVHMPYVHNSLEDLYSSKDIADTKCSELNAVNDSPMELDEYGPLNGCKYFVVHLEVK